MESGIEVSEADVGEFVRSLVTQLSKATRERDALYREVLRLRSEVSDFENLFGERIGRPDARGPG